MNGADVLASVTSVAVSDTRTSVVVREVPVETIRYSLSPWQPVSVTKEVKP